MNPDGNKSNPPLTHSSTEPTDLASTVAAHAQAIAQLQASSPASPDLAATLSAHTAQIEYLANLLLAIGGTFFPSQTRLVQAGLGAAEDVFAGLNLSHTSPK